MKCLLRQIFPLLFYIINLNKNVLQEEKHNCCLRYKFVVKTTVAFPVGKDHFSFAEKEEDKTKFKVNGKFVL